MFGSLLNSILGGGAAPNFPVGMPAPAAAAGETFKPRYRCYPVAAANKQSLEAGDKIILPSSALTRLAYLQVVYPMMFRLFNPSRPGHKTHCGVMEFSAEEGVAYLPYWMMQNLLIESGSMIVVENVKIPKGTYVKFQPHTIKFTQLHNPRIVLERALRNFSCLTKGDTIVIQHGDQNFYLDVIELKSASNPTADAVCIIEADVNVDFDPPKDAPLGYIPAKTAPTASSSSSSSTAKTDDVKSSDGFNFHGSSGSSGYSGHTSTNINDVDDGGGSWGSSGKDDVIPAEKTQDQSATSYFAKLGSGNKLSAKKTTASPSPGMKPTTSSTTPSSYSLGPSSTPTPTASSVSSASSTSAPSRPSSALSARGGGYKLASGPVPTQTTSSPMTTSASDPAPPTAPKTVVQREGRFDYVYEIDQKGGKRLIRRIPVSTLTSPTASSSTAKPTTQTSSSSAFTSQGHKLN